MALSANYDMKVSAEDALEGDGAAAKAKSGSSSLKVLGALVGVTVVLGGIWLGFGDKIMGMIGTSDAAVPVITADPAPIKVRPENPGGMNVPNQGRLVYGVVDGISSQPRVERLLPSPEKPVKVDNVLKRGVPETSQVVAETAPRGSADTSGAPMRLEAGAPVAETPSADDVAALKQPAPALAPTESPSSSGIAPPAPTSVAPEPAAKAAVPVAAPKQAPVPPTTQTETATNTATPAPPSPGGDISNSYRIQLAASRSDKAVEAEWDRLRRRHIDLLGELRLQVTRIDLGATKGVFYRLRAGPLADEAAAKTLCERLKQRKLGCLVVKPGA